MCCPLMVIYLDWIDENGQYVDCNLGVGGGGGAK
jgi:hypothetical protein